MPHNTPGTAGYVEAITVGELQSNCYLIDDGCGGVVVIDPGADAAVIRSALAGRPVDLVLVTHAHFDHIGAVDEIAALSSGGWAIGARDAEDIADTLTLGRSFGVEASVTGTPTRLLSDGEVIEVGELTLRTMICPGHSAGSLVFIDDAHHQAWVGDLLFAGSVGRTDLPGGDDAALSDSLVRFIDDVPADTIIYPGHGPATTVAREIASNPFVIHAQINKQV